MTPTETVAFLRNYNVWRRGNLDDQPMPDPREIGEAIDAAVEMIDRLEAAEKDVALKEKVIDALGSELNAVAKERDALKAKIAEMEKQYPICRIKDIRRAHYLTKVVGLDPEAWLYALPGAQSQLNEIRTALQRALELGARETWTGSRKHRSWEDQREEQQCWNKVWSLLDVQGEEK